MTDLAAAMPVVGAAVPMARAAAEQSALTVLPAAAQAPDPTALTCAWRLPFPLDLIRTLAVHRRGTGDPAFRVDDDGSVWRTSLAPDGPATLRIAVVRRGADDPGRACDRGEAGDWTVVQAEAWGPGAQTLLATVPDLLGAADDATGFDPLHPVLRDAWRRHPGVRLGRSGRVLEALVPAVLEQKVVATEAWRAWRLLLSRFGTPAPGPAPAGMRVFPPPRVWARIPSWEWHRAGAEAVRARTVIGAAMVAGRLEEIIGLPSAEADRRLRSLPGIGPWTSAEVRQRACGDPDAVSVGDYHLPSLVGWALAGRKTDDAGMLELLAPYGGHRYRATKLVELSGVRPPRHGPRFAPRDYRPF